MISIKLKTTGLDVDIEDITSGYLKNITDMIADDIQENLSSQRVVTSELGGNYAAPARLSPSYLTIKRKSYPSTDVFKGKELRLINSIKVKRIGKLSHRIYIGDKKRENIAEWINYGTARMPERMFFGVSRDILDRIEKEFNLKKIA